MLRSLMVELKYDNDTPAVLYSNPFILQWNNPMIFWKTAQILSVSPGPKVIWVMDIHRYPVQSVWMYSPLWCHYTFYACQPIRCELIVGTGTNQLPPLLNYYSMSTVTKQLSSCFWQLTSCAGDLTSSGQVPCGTGRGAGGYLETWTCQHKLLIMSTCVFTCKMCVFVYLCVWAACRSWIPRCP